MITRRVNHCLVSLFTCLFLMVQGYGVTHAAQYGEGQHEHDGVVCVVGTVAHDEDAVLPPAFTIPLPTQTVFTFFYEQKFNSADRTTPPGRAPPPRSPPVSFQ